MKKILVTGGAGFLGAPVVKALVKQGYDVTALDDYSRGDPLRLKNVPCRSIPGDVRNPKWVDLAVAGQDCVIHMAAVNGTDNFYKHPAKVLDVGVRGMINVVDACRLHGVKEFVLVSSSEVYQTPAVVPTPEDVPLSLPDPRNPRYSYAASKILSELWAFHCGAFDRLVVVRPHNVYGPNGGEDHVVPQFCRRLRNVRDGKFPIQGTGAESRAFCYVDDFVEGFLVALAKGRHREIYNVGTDVETTVKALILALFWLAGLSDWTEIVPGPLQVGGTLRRCPDVSKLRSLGWTPKWDLIDGLHDTLAWYDKNPAPEAK